MPSMFFGQYLLAKGLINRNALLDAIRRGREVNLPIPTLAVREGHISPSKAAGLMALFRTSERSIEDICIKSGALSDSIFQELKEIQDQEHQRIGDCLVEGKHLSRDDVDRHAKEFQAQERLDIQRIESNLDRFPESQAISTSIDLVVFHFQRMANCAAKIKTVELAHGEIKDNRRRYAQRIVSDSAFTIAVDLPDVLAHRLAEGFLGITVESGGEVAQDAVCEFVNVVGGNACTHLEKPGCRVLPEPPFTSGIDTPPKPDGESICAELISEDAPFEIHLFFE